MKLKSILATLPLTIFATASALAGPDFQAGKISNLTFEDQSALIMLDTGLPTNCTGTQLGWMKVPATSQLLSSLLMNIWLNGVARTTDITVYTSGLGVDGYCQITQITPHNLCREPCPPPPSG